MIYCRFQFLNYTPISHTFFNLITKAGVPIVQTISNHFLFQFQFPILLPNLI